MVYGRWQIEGRPRYSNVYPIMRSVKPPLYMEYDKNTHEFLTHLRRLDSTQPELEGPNGTMIKGAQPLAPPGEPLYYYHSRTKIYGPLFYWFWDTVFAPMYRLCFEGLFEAGDSAAVDTLLALTLDM
jgi:hypothetical protein